MSNEPSWVKKSERWLRGNAMWDRVVKDAESKMKKTLEVTHNDFSKLRTGRANPHLLDSIRVQYYGAPTVLKQLATISIPEPRMIILQPYDLNSVREIEKAIQGSDTGLVPMVDGKIIRISIPALSKERREELVKIVKKVAEDGRISMRSIRRDANDQVKKLEKDKKITEDESFKAHDRIQKITDQHVRELDGLASDKEKDLLTV